MVTVQRKADAMVHGALRPRAKPRDADGAIPVPGARRRFRRMGIATGRIVMELPLVPPRLESNCHGRTQTAPARPISRHRLIGPRRAVPLSSHAMGILACRVPPTRGRDGRTGPEIGGVAGAARCLVHELVYGHEPRRGISALNFSLAAVSQQNWPIVRWQSPEEQAMRLQGKTALVTGASGGIGRGIIERLASEGADIVVAVHTSDNEAQEVAEAVRARGRRAWVVAGRSLQRCPGRRCREPSSGGGRPTAHCRQQRRYRGPSAVPGTPPRPITTACSTPT
ncbi:SDR family NAD(P)-dependent oxidoreductase [Cupriavidus basilensis]